MSVSRDEFRVGVLTVLSGETAVDIEFESPMVDAAYDVFFQARQSGSYDVWSSGWERAGFRMNINPAAAQNLRYSYIAVDRSYKEAPARAGFRGALFLMG